MNNKFKKEATIIPDKPHGIFPAPPPVDDPSVDSSLMSLQPSDSQAPMPNKEGGGANKKWEATFQDLQNAFSDWELINTKCTENQNEAKTKGKTNSFSQSTKGLNSVPLSEASLIEVKTLLAELKSQLEQFKN